MRCDAVGREHVAKYPERGQRGVVQLMAPETHIKMRAPRRAAESVGTSRARRSVVDKPPGDLEAYRQLQKHLWTVATGKATGTSKPVESVETSEKWKKKKKAIRTNARGAR